MSQHVLTLTCDEFGEIPNDQLDALKGFKVEAGKLEWDEKLARMEVNWKHISEPLTAAEGIARFRECSDYPVCRLLLGSRIVMSVNPAEVFAPDEPVVPSTQEFNFSFESEDGSWVQGTYRVHTLEDAMTLLKADHPDDIGADGYWTLENGDEIPIDW